jgi:hypothetical protein
MSPEARLLHFTRLAVGLPVIACTADEVLWALLRAGFELHERRGPVMILRQGARIVELPTVTALVPAELFSVLRQAGLSYNDLIELIADAPTDRDVDKESHVRKKRP